MSKPTSPTYSVAAIQACLTMKMLFRMALRLTTGFVESLLRLTGLVAVRFNADMNAKYDPVVAAGKEKKVAITAVMRKMLVLANALLRDQRKWGRNQGRSRRILGTSLHDALQTVDGTGINAVPGSHSSFAQERLKS